MTRPTRRLRTRLLVAMVAIAFGTLVVAAAGAAAIAKRTASDSALLDLPKDLRVHDLDLVELVAGKTQDGVSGSRAYVATPLTPVGGATPVVVVTQQVERRPLGRAGTFLLITGGLALVAAALVSAYLARRMTRPLAAMEDAAGRIAAGDLSVRVDTEGLHDDELADLTRSFNVMASELETARGHERAFLLSISHDL